MNKIKMKSLMLLICAALLLTCTVSSTVAYLVAGPSSVTNTFTPTSVETEIQEPDKTDTSKPKIIIHNKGNIKVFVRVALVANWCDADGNIVMPWDGTISLGSGWSKGSNDNYYYYNPALDPDDNVAGSGTDQTSNLLGAAISGEDATKADLHLEVVVIQQAIQADGLGEGIDTAQEAFAQAAATTK